MYRPESGSGHVSTFVLRDKFRCVERPESSTRHASTVVCRDKCRCTKMPESGSELETTCSCSGQAGSGMWIQLSVEGRRCQCVVSALPFRIQRGSCGSSCSQRIKSAVGVSAGACRCPQCEVGCVNRYLQSQRQEVHM